MNQRLEQIMVRNITKTHIGHSRRTWGRCLAQSEHSGRLSLWGAVTCTEPLRMSKRSQEKKGEKTFQKEQQE